jgi:predicted amidohydrolase
MLPILRAAAVSVESRPGETEENLARMAEAAAQAAGTGAQLVMFPELSVTGFLPNHPVGDHNAWLRAALRIARRIAQPIPGPATAELARLAGAHGVWLAAGLLEDAGNLLYNAFVLVGPEGLAGVWRKMHIPMFEMPFYNGGGVPEVAETPLGRIGANVCFDALLPESTRLLAVQDVEIVLFPFAADPPPGDAAAWAAWAETSLRARCMENGVYGIACNFRGRVEAAGAVQEFPGGAMIVGPRGEVLARELGGAPLVFELTREMLTEARAEPEYLFRFRRPELYGRLAG